MRKWQNVKRGMLSLYSNLNGASVTVAGTSVLGSDRSCERTMREDFFLVNLGVASHGMLKVKAI